MTIEQLYTGCLAQGAYYIESEGEAAVIDPLRETRPYMQKAERNGAKIKYVFETHFHADFVSGHIDLAAKTGATIIFGPNANPGYDAHIAKDGAFFTIGKLQVKVLHTPGHTMESTTYLLFDENGKEHAIFTGDTLFIGDVGRPDLAAKSALTQEDLAGYLYDSLHSKIMPLPDEVIVYPAHGKGSACGKNMSNETFDTLGRQKEINYALKAESKAEFIKQVTDGLTPPPFYFPKNVLINKQGYASFDEVLNKGTRALSPENFELVAETEEALVIDTRDPNVFAEGFIPNAINIGIGGDFAPWIGTLVTDINQPILFVAEAGKEEEVITRLARVGYDNVLGYLAGGFAAWQAAGKETDAVTNISAEEFAAAYTQKNIHVVDVRRESEFNPSHVKGAKHAPLDYINDHLAAFDKEQTNYLHCAGGYRSMIAASILKARGYQNIVNVKGGYKAISATDIAKDSAVQATA